MENKKCLIKECENKETTRGLCMKCRSIASAMISNGDTTEEELVAMGMILPQTKKESFFRLQFKELKNHE